MLRVDSKLELTMQQSEVDSVLWKDLYIFKKEVLADDDAVYVPHGDLYYKNLVSAIETELSGDTSG